MIRDSVVFYNYRIEIAIYVYVRKFYAIVELLVEGKLASSKSEARRKIKEGAVEVDGTKIVDETGRVEIGKSSLIRLGKRFLRIK